MRKMNSWLAAVLCCVMTMAVFTACVNDSSRPMLCNDNGGVHRMCKRQW